MAFVDEVTIHAQAGRGGNGVIRWLRVKETERERERDRERESKRDRIRRIGTGAALQRPARAGHAGDVKGRSHIERRAADVMGVIRSQRRAFAGDVISICDYNFHSQVAIARGVPRTALIRVEA